jgi:thiol:disulfide interchange protein DsbA
MVEVLNPMKTIYATLFSVILLVAGDTAYAAQPDQAEYVTINPPLATHTGNKVEVLEIFWYGCPHCYAFEPYLQKWLKTKPANVEFRLMPGILNRAWVAHARAYYTAEKLGILDQIHHQLFDAIHKDRRNIFDEDSIKAFFIEQGVDGDEFSKVYDSKEIDEELKQAVRDQISAKVTGVPTLIIDGKYLTSPSMTGSYETLEQVLNSLIKKASQGS